MCAQKPSSSVQEEPRGKEMIIVLASCLLNPCYMPSEALPASLAHSLQKGRYFREELRIQWTNHWLLQEQEFNRRLVSFKRCNKLVLGVYHHRNPFQKVSRISRKAVDIIWTGVFNLINISDLEDAKINRP